MRPVNCLQHTNLLARFARMINPCLKTSRWAGGGGGGEEELVHFSPNVNIGNFFLGGVPPCSPVSYAYVKGPKQEVYAPYAPLPPPPLESGLDKEINCFISFTHILQLIRITLCSVLSCRTMARMDRRGVCHSVLVPCGYHGNDWRWHLYLRRSGASPNNFSTWHRTSAFVLQILLVPAYSLSIRLSDMIPGMRTRERCPLSRDFILRRVHVLRTSGHTQILSPLFCSILYGLASCSCRIWKHDVAGDSTRMPHKLLHLQQHHLRLGILCVWPFLVPYVYNTQISSPATQWHCARRQTHFAVARCRLRA